jgi:DNA-binding response OmpR family regulator
MLRRMPHLADTPALFVTGLTSADDIVRYMDAGAIGVIPKPLMPLRLTDQLHSLWEQHALSA